jgi:two-component system, chemotaxis family, CheB/CheR fusion protein
MAKKVKDIKASYNTPVGRMGEPPSGGETSVLEQRGFSIVGIGASAGGLEALEQLFSHIPPNSGIAFVVIQHLDPSGHSSMPEILSRFTGMPIQVASDGLKVEPNSIYLIPPSKSMGIKNGLLYLREPAQPPGLRLPIDFFFRSLSSEKGPDAICIILSGTGTDGTLGLRAIKAEQGTVFVQDPESAKYDGMPRSAIDSGLADYVLKPDLIPEKLIKFLKLSAINGARSDTVLKEAAEPLQRIFSILRTRTGHDFSRYKSATIRRRVERRMSVNQINDIAEYARFLKGSEDEMKALLKDLLISVTNFFRDPDAFEALKVQLKELLKRKAQNSELRVWVAGCATGEEAYSIVIIISECLDELKKRLQIQLYGTDIDTNALQIARAGKYPANIVANVTAKHLKHYFVKQGDAYSIKKEIRERVVFAPQDFIKDPPFSRMDLICCRNLLIYLESDVQTRLLPLLHYALNPGGILFLGTSETIGDARDLFVVLEKKWKIYQRREVVLAADRLRFPASFAPSSREPAVGPIRGVTESKIPELAEKIFLDDYAPTFAVIDEKYRLVYVRGRTGKYLEIASGQPSLNILEMAREGLRTDLGSAIYRATSEKKKIVHEGVRVKNSVGFQTINLTVAPLTEPGIPPGFLIIVFQDAELINEESEAKPSAKGRKRVTLLKEELRLTSENLQATIEALEAANEEMKSANEELQSNNEELQSTNEELDTSHEELQSLNEELNTLNSELQDKNELLNRANDDLNNFVNRTDIAIILLDDELKIRSFTPATSEILNIRKIDVGRPFAEITSRLAYDKMTDEAHEVLRTLQPRETEVQRKDGHWYNLRISSYRTAQNVMSGLVISLLDINEQKKAAGVLSETRDYLDNLLNYANAPIIVWNPEFKITVFNHAFEQLTGRRADKMLGKKVDILIPLEQRKDAMEKINRTTIEGKRWEVVEIPVQHIDGSIRTVLWNSATLFAMDEKTPVATIAQGQDVTERKKVEAKLGHLASFPELDPLPIIEFETTGNIKYANPSLRKTCPDIDKCGAAHPFLKDWESILRSLRKKGSEEITREIRFGDSWYLQTWIKAPSGLVRVYAQDITELKRAEDAFKLSEERFRTLSETSPVGVGVSSTDGVLLYTNASYELILGYKHNELLGTKANDLYWNPEDRRSWLNTMKDVGIARDIETRLKRKDGTSLWVSINASPISYGGQPAVMGTIQDITGRKQAEVEQKRLHAELADRLNELESVLDTSPVAIWISRDPRCRTITGNTYANELFGVASGANISKSAQPDEVAVSYRVLQKGIELKPEQLPAQIAASSGKTVAPQEFEIVFENGRRLYLLEGAVPLLDSAGHPRGSVSVGSDITEQKQEMNIKDEFIGMVSHELRTPLTVIIGALNTALDERASKEQVIELVQEAGSSAESLANILNNMLELSRFQAGRMTLEKNAVKIADISGKAVDRIRRKYDTHKITMDMPEGIPERPVDAIRIELVLYNLLENAVKYSPVGSEVRIFCRLEKDDLVVGVSDSGIGISQDDQKKIFEPFGRLEGSGAKGIGLGLVVCKHLVEAHRGCISVESQKGKGSTFRFSIPLEVKEPKDG